MRLCLFGILVVQVLLLTSFRSSFHNAQADCDDDNINANDQGDQLMSTEEDDLRKVTPRAFPLWSKELPCFPPDKNWWLTEVQRSPSKLGFLFMKEMKTGSSTLSGVNIRIAKKVAERLHPDDFKLCKSRFDHSMAIELSYAQRIRDKSFLWTILREPTQRSTSQFFHFKVSRAKKEPSDLNFQNYLTHPLFQNYYLKTLSTRMYRSKSDNVVDVANKIMLDYDFIGITERFDESLVVLAMLLGLELTDVLYLSAKGSGGYDDGRYERKCVYIVRPYVSPSMKEFFDAKPWRTQIRGDNLLYNAALESLDMTIESLGRSEFDANLARFLLARDMAEKECADTVMYPCNVDGVRRPQAPGCLWNDSGCGYSCVEEVAAKFNSKYPKKTEEDKILS